VRRPASREIAAIGSTPISPYSNRPTSPRSLGTRLDRTDNDPTDPKIPLSAIAMSIAIFDDHGIRFEYPGDWELEPTDDGPRLTVTVQSPSGLAFALVTVDEDRPAPAELVDEALAALKDEYPTLHAVPALESIDGHKAVGHDVEFSSLDLNNAGAIRAFQTPRRTIFCLAQWSDDLEGEEAEHTLKALFRSLEETDA
jgi:hypothetical protein